ncbi:hypothetical protein [Desulfosediminicola ganghwensis]|nr:hypothetical protein [Desulfosediminicola ganghwensis]
MKKQSWWDPSRYIQHIHVDESCVDDPYAREILERAQLPWDVIAKGDDPA